MHFFIDARRNCQLLLQTIDCFSNNFTVDGIIFPRQPHYSTVFSSNRKSSHCLFAQRERLIYTVIKQDVFGDNGSTDLSSSSNKIFIIPHNGELVGHGIEYISSYIQHTHTSCLRHGFAFNYFSA